MRPQEAVPADNSLVSLMLQTRNKETGAGLTDLQVVAQTNTFIAAGAAQLSSLQFLTTAWGTAMKLHEGVESAVPEPLRSV